MKLKYILPVLLLGCSSLTYAQKKFPKEHSFGVTGGMTLSKMTFRPRVVQDFLPGATFGVTYRYIEEKYFGIQAELHFTQKGWKDRLEEYPQLHYERKLNYMELPVMTHIFFGNNRVRGFVNAGPQICYLLASKIDKNVFGEIDEETAHHDIPVKNRFDYGIVGGAGMEFRFGKNSVLIDGRYYFGLGDVFPNEKKDYFETSSNQSISINLTYMFRL